MENATPFHSIYRVLFVFFGFFWPAELTGARNKSESRKSRSTGVVFVVPSRFSEQNP